MNHHRVSRNHRFLHLGALPLLISTGLLVSACGDGNESAGTTTSTGTGGSSSSTTTSDTGGGGSGGNGGSGGSVTNPNPCDPIANDCVEAEASKCTITLDADDYGNPVCEAPLGDQQLGDDCVRPDGQSGHDTCAGGLYCVSFPKPVSSPQQRECVAMCDEATACAADQACIPISTNPFGICLQQCKPFEGSCGSDPTQACDVWSTVGGGTQFACGHTGLKKSFESCMYTDDCPADHSCRGGLCRPYCNDTHLCAEPSDACLLFTDSPDLAAYGSCFHVDDSCLGAVVLAPPMNAEEMVMIQVVDIVSGTSLAGATVKACAADDVMCAAPLGQTTADAVGAATLTVPTTGAGFEGYFEATAPGYLPQLFYFNNPIAGPGTGFYSSLGTKEGLVAAFVGSPVADLSRGIVAGIAVDCAGIVLGGAVFSLDTADASTLVGHALPSYGGATLPPDAVDPAATSSQSGGFMALNVPVGMADVGVTTLDGQAIGHRAVISRAGALTIVLIEPAP